MYKDMRRCASKRTQSCVIEGLSMRVLAYGTAGLIARLRGLSSEVDSFCATATNCHLTFAPSSQSTTIITFMMQSPSRICHIFS
jgi:hypothetical protein